MGWSAAGLETRCRTGVLPHSEAWSSLESYWTWKLVWSGAVESLPIHRSKASGS